MLDYTLFIGLLLDDAYLRELEEVPPSLRDLLIQSQDDTYLRQIDFEGKVYLGKFLEPPMEVSSLETVQAHIHSILKRLVPYYSYDEHPLVLLALDISGNQVNTCSPKI